MKKIILFFVILFFFTQSVFAKTKIIKGKYYEGEIKFYDLKYDLPYGKWLSLGKKNRNNGRSPKYRDFLYRFCTARR